jgi:hypothetical protein
MNFSRDDYAKPTGYSGIPFLTQRCDVLCIHPALAGMSQPFLGCARPSLAVMQIVMASRYQHASLCLYGCESSPRLLASKGNNEKIMARAPAPFAPRTSCDRLFCGRNCSFPASLFASAPFYASVTSSITYSPKLISEQQFPDPTTTYIVAYVSHEGNLAQIFSHQTQGQLECGFPRHSDHA